MVVFVGRLLVVVGGYWWLLVVVVGGCWRLLVTVGNCWCVVGGRLRRSSPGTQPQGSGEDGRATGARLGTSCYAQGKTVSQGPFAP